MSSIPFFLYLLYHVRFKKATYFEKIIRKVS
nr:MAG TPA: hypothetical protein [Caudoviricetes sp.]